MRVCAFVAALVAVLVLAGCKGGEPKPDFVDVAGTYAGENANGPASTLILGDDGTFTILDNKNNGKGKYTRKGTELTLVIDELNGKAALFDVHSKPLKLVVSADRSKLDSDASNLHFKKK